MESFLSAQKSTIEIFVFQENDRSKRFDYLLQQTEIFAHFMTNNAKDKGASPAKKPGRPPKIKDGNKSGGAPSASGEAGE